MWNQWMGLSAYLSLFLRIWKLTLCILVVPWCCFSINFCWMWHCILDCLLLVDVKLSFWNYGVVCISRWPLECTRKVYLYHVRSECALQEFTSRSTKMTVMEIGPPGLSHGCDDLHLYFAPHYFVLNKFSACISRVNETLHVSISLIKSRQHTLSYTRI